MKDRKHSSVSVDIKGDQMSKSDAGKVAILNTKRELLREIGAWLIKVSLLAIGAWKGGDILHTVVAITVKNWFGA